MDKKTIKAILDVIKDVSDRKGLYGCQFVSHDHISGSPYLYFTNGYVAIRLTCGEYEGLRPINMDMWVSGEQLKEIYKGMGARDVALDLKDDDEPAAKNEGRLSHPDWEKCWGQWSDTETINSSVEIRPDTFKKLAPFGDMVMTVTQNKMGQKLIAFNGKGVDAFVCPLKGA